MIPILQVVGPGAPFSEAIAMVLVGILLAMAYLAAQIRSGITLLAFAVAVVLVGFFLVGLVTFQILVLGMAVAAVIVAVLGILSWRVW